MSDTFDHEADAWDSLLLEDPEYSSYGGIYFGYSDKVCKYCGKTGLRWIETEDGFRLAEWTYGVGTRRHYCTIPATESKIDFAEEIKKQLK
jgi:hypothetical protein